MSIGSATPDRQAGRSASRIALLATRIGLPVLLVVIGAVLIVMGHGHYTNVLANRDSLYSGVGVGFIVIALMVALLNWMLRMNQDDLQDRVKEEQAREHFRRTGSWPGDE